MISQFFTTYSSKASSTLLFLVFAILMICLTAYFSCEVYPIYCSDDTDQAMQAVVNESQTTSSGYRITHPVVLAGLITGISGLATGAIATGKVSVIKAIGSAAIGLPAAVMSGMIIQDNHARMVAKLESMMGSTSATDGTARLNHQLKTATINKEMPSAHEKINELLLKNNQGQEVANKTITDSVTSEENRKNFSRAFQGDSNNSQTFPRIQSPLEPGDKNPELSWMEYLLGYKVDLDTHGAFTNLLYQFKGLVNIAMVHYIEVFLSLVLLLLFAVVYSILSIYKNSTYYDHDKSGVKLDSMSKISLFPKGKFFRFILVMNFVVIFLNLPFLIRHTITLKNTFYFYSPEIGRAFDEIAMSSIAKVGGKYLLISEFPFKVMENISYISQMNDIILPLLFIPFTIYSVYLVVYNNVGVLLPFLNFFFFFLISILFTLSTEEVFPKQVSTYEELLPANQVVLDSLFMTSVCSIVLFMIFIVLLLFIIKFQYKPNSFFFFSTTYLFFLCQIKTGLIMYYLYYCSIPIELAVLLDDLLGAALDLTRMNGS